MTTDGYTDTECALSWTEIQPRRTNTICVSTVDPRYLEHPAISYTRRYLKPCGYLVTPHYQQCRTKMPCFLTWNAAIYFSYCKMHD